VGWGFDVWGVSQDLSVYESWKMATGDTVVGSLLYVARGIGK
jgi:hypothetical protein